MWSFANPVDVSRRVVRMKGARDSRGGAVALGAAAAGACVAPQKARAILVVAVEEPDAQTSAQGGVARVERPAS